jgi:hypothetical protein
MAVSASPQSTEKDILVKHRDMSGEFTSAVAKAMPADGYTFRPVPVEMSFGELMMHIATANRGACARRHWRAGAGVAGEDCRVDEGSGEGGSG